LAEGAAPDAAPETGNGTITEELASVIDAWDSLPPDTRTAIAWVKRCGPLRLPVQVDMPELVSREVGGAALKMVPSDRWPCGRRCLIMADRINQGEFRAVPGGPRNRGCQHPI